jgi:hypothetical protein
MLGDKCLERLGVLGGVFGPDRVVEAFASQRDDLLKVIGQLREGGLR